MKKVIILTMLILFCAISAVGYEEKESLRGIDGVHVIVSNISPKFEAYGMSSPNIKTDVELRLRQLGITVLTEKEWVESPRRQCLFVYLNCLLEKGLCVYNITVELNQNVYSAVTPFTPFYAATTWSIGSVGFVGVDYIKSVRENIINYVNQFANDYLEMNPKI